MTPRRAFRLLLHVYPAEFRARFGAGMLESLTHDYDAARDHGLRAVAQFWTITIAQAACFGACQRLAPTGRSSSAGNGLRKRLASSLDLDVRDAWRTLAAAPIVTVIATLSLAIGVGANLSLFAIANGLMLKPLPVREPARLVLLDNGSWTNPIWEQLREIQADLFEGAFAWSNERFDLAAGGTKDPVDGAYVSGSAFEVLGVRALLGRTLAAADDVRGGGTEGPVAVISHAFWQRRYGGDSNVLGSLLNIDRVPFTIVGVTPPGFAGVEVGRAWDVMVPLGAEPVIKGRDSSLDGRSVWWLEIMARLKDGSTIEQATAALRAAQPRIRDATRPAAGRSASHHMSEPLTLAPAATGRSQLRVRYKQPLAIIIGVAAAVLLIACANIANLLLVRAAARSHELGVRLALGASRWRIARQLLLESLMVASAGTLCGVAIAIPGSTALLRQFGAPGQPPVVDLSVDWRVTVFAIGITCATALLFGLAPAAGV